MRVSAPMSVSTATNEPTTPTRPIGIASHFVRSGRNTSTTSTSRIVLARMISGSRAW